MLSVIKHIKENGLENTLDTFNLKCREYDNKVLIKYDQINSNMSHDEVQDSRGLILEKGTWNVMCLSFRKFFNSAESYASKIDWDTASVLEKLDGTMIQLYYDWNKKEWFAATTGTAEGEGEVNNRLGTNFNSLFWETVSDKYNFDKSKLNEDFIYVFELTTPYNIVVKPHGESSATLIASRNRVTLEEVDYDSLLKVGENLGVPVVKRYNFENRNVGELMRTFKDMVYHDEGYVVVDGNFNRVKVKNPAYVYVHHMKSKTAEHNIMEVVKSNEIEEFAASFPDRREEIFELYYKYNELIKKLEEGWKMLDDKKPKNITKAEKKKFAMAVFDVCKKLDVKPFNGLYFGLNSGKVDSVESFMENYDNKKLYKML